MQGTRRKPSLLGKTTYFSRFSHIMVQVGGITRYQSASVASNNHSNVGTVTRAPFYQRQTSSAFSDGLTLWKMRSGGQGIEQLSEGYKIVIAMVADLAASSSLPHIAPSLSWELPMWLKLSI